MTIDEAIKNAALTTDEVPYSILHLPPTAITAAAGVIAHIGEAFTALIVDPDEVTLILPAEVLDDAAIARRLPDAQPMNTQYRRLTLDTSADIYMVGFMARISVALAAAGVNIMPYASYARDHIFVPADKFDAAVGAIEQLKASI